MIIFGSPGRYVQGQGSLDRVGPELARLGSSAVIIIDPSVESVLDRIERSCADASVSLSVARFGGESSPEEVGRLERELQFVRSDVIASVGGGKCIDTGKALAKRLGSRMATIPTIASNDSPTSHIYVLYDSSHKLLAVEELERNPDLVLVDTGIIAKAPAHLLLAGIGDAVVKKYEVERCMETMGRNVFGSQPSLAALIMARGCFDVLRADSVDALAAVRAQMPNAALERVVEVCILMSGLSFENGGLCIAHAMTRGLSAVHPVASALHGFQVAYGVTVQLVLEGRDAAFMADHAGFFRKIGLPLSLREIGLENPSDAQLGLIADLTLAAPHMRNFPRPVEREEFIAALRDVENAYAKA